jgi:hypothetical protein
VRDENVPIDGEAWDGASLRARVPHSMNARARRGRGTATRK